MTREQRRLAREIFAKAMFISEYTPADCFVDYMPHVDGLAVTLYHNGWKSGADANQILKILNYTHTEEDMVRALNDMDAYLSETPIDTNKWMEEQ